MQATALEGSGPIAALLANRQGKPGKVCLAPCREIRQGPMMRHLAATPGHRKQVDDNHAERDGEPYHNAPRQPARRLRLRRLVRRALFHAPHDTTAGGEP
jgi:hypothetical protein